MTEPVQPLSRFTDYDISLFRAGKHFRLYEKLGAHLTEHNGQTGVYFSVWAPSAREVFVIGDFNHWSNEHPLNVRWDSSGIFEGFVPGVAKGVRYKFRVVSSHGGVVTEKADPLALFCEHPPNTASIVWELDYPWHDDEWMRARAGHNALDRPHSVYEVHLGSWRRNSNGSRMSYQTLAKELVDYVREMNFTHVELMPITEYPFDPSWGYQSLGYFAPTSRFGDPQGFMYLVDSFHQAGIGVILDWVPAHFPDDAHGLANFDGSHLYEHPDPRKGYHPDWKSLIFNYERSEVRAFLISSALFWLHHYHVDGLRIDAVSSMIYLDYSREDGEWEPNIYGGRENLAAVSFLRELNENVYNHYPDVQTIAEESTAYTGVSRPVSAGGLGFGMKWMMGWMHDTLEYFRKDPVYRSHHQNDLSFSLTYAFSENFMLPLSHDEVVHGKCSLIGRMPGDHWQRAASLRLLYGYMFAHPGTKLLFMGCEFGQSDEWDALNDLQWHLLQFPEHQGVRECVRALNELYRSQPALYEKQFSPQGFEWICYDDSANSTLSWLRLGHDRADDLVVVCNCTPQVHEAYRLGVPRAGVLSEIFNSDANRYAGSGRILPASVQTEDHSSHGRDNSVVIALAPLAMQVLRYTNGFAARLHSRPDTPAKQ
ncbi:MAG: 1,4-alpha-glucan branching protein GlgB [Proteobacteria bacterium]|nr:1,4-alpha-glucan branching protein GlgB [Pseudomonadota bacterium]